MLNILVPPAATWSQPSIPNRARAQLSTTRKTLQWCDHAESHEWEEAVAAFLRENWRGQHGFWSVLNAIVAEARPETRWQKRMYAKEALHALMRLIRQKKVLRYRKRWIASLELPHEVIPLDEIPPGKLART